MPTAGRRGACRYREAGGRLFAVTEEQSTGLTSYLSETTDLGIQLGDVAAPYAEKMMALLNAVAMVLVLYPWIHGLTQGDQPVLRGLLQTAVAIAGACSA